MTRGVSQLEIKSFNFDAQLSRGFADLCGELYGGDSNWIPPSRNQLLSQFAPDFSFYQKAGNQHRHFAALRDGNVIGHVSAFVNADMRDPEGNRVGCLGFFECIDDYPVAERLLEQAVGWLRTDQGANCIWGPLNFDIWHGYRFMTRGFGERLFYGEPYNKQYYPEFFERFGFVVRKSWCSLEITGRKTWEGIVAKNEKFYRQISEKGYRFERARANDPGVLRVLHSLIAASYQGFLGYTPIPLADFNRLIGAFLRTVGTRFLLVIYNDRNQVAGFSIAYPDVSDAIRVMRGSDNLRARLRFLLRRRSAGRVVYLLLGITPREIEKRHGLGGAVSHYAMHGILDAGYETTVLALIAQDSLVRRIVGPGIEQAQREYALYELSAK